MQELYESVVLDHYRSPRKSAGLEGSKQEHKLLNPFCGDEVVVQIKGENRVDQIAVLSQGCAISTASGSMMGEALENKAFDECSRLISNAREYMKGKDLKKEDLEELCDFEYLVGVRKFPVRIKCALLAWTAAAQIVAPSSSKP